MTGRMIQLEGVVSDTGRMLCKAPIRWKEYNDLRIPI